MTRPLVSISGSVKKCWCGHGADVHILEGGDPEWDPFPCAECDCPDMAPLVGKGLFSRPAPVGMYEQRGPS